MDMQQVRAQHLRRMCVCWTPHRLVSLTAVARAAEVPHVISAARCSLQELSSKLPVVSGRTERSFTTCFAAQAEVLEAAEPSVSVNGTPGYDAQQIQVLQGLDPVRKRPGMYIGSTGTRGLHHLIFEVLDNCIDEVQGGHATNVEVEIDMETGRVTISDDGRGIPTDIHPATGKSALETVLTVLHAGGKFGGDSSGYTVSGGLHGVGISVVNALSSELEVTVWKQAVGNCLSGLKGKRNGKEYQQSYRSGEAASPLQESQLPKSKRRTGTCIRFLYDRGVFAKNAVYDPDTVRTRLRELAFLNSTATIKFRAPHSGNGSAAAADWQVFHFSRGLADYIEFLNRDKEPMHPPISISKMVDNVVVDVALQWCSDAYSDTLVGFANSVKTTDGGSHMDGLKSALTRSINLMARKNKALKEGDPNLSGDNIREGLGGIIAVKVILKPRLDASGLVMQIPEPEFEGQTKTRLGNPEVRKITEGIVSQGIQDALDANSATLEAILSKAVAAFRAAEAARKARELVRRKSVLTKSALPGKLADCSSTDAATTEIFIVEGDSAGGSAKQARDRRFQAILPLRGKILNVERTDDATLYKNSEISNLIIGLGLGVRGEVPKELRYGKIILLTDADVDGAHIRTLLLTFLYRYSRDVFNTGHIYVGVPPLYKLDIGRKSQYCYDEEELQREIKGRAPGSYQIQRFKGLGEMMPEQLWDTTLNPATRKLKRLTVEDAAEVDHTITMLMGKKVAPRRELIEQHGSRISLADLDI